LIHDPRLFECKVTLITEEEKGTAFARKIGIPADFPPKESIFTGSPYVAGNITAILVIDTWRRV
jgi:hypothetical protein